MEPTNTKSLDRAWEYFSFVHSTTEKTPDVVVHDDSQFSRIVHGAMGLASEAGEVLAVVLKDLFKYKRKPGESLSRELGDAFWYFALILFAAKLKFVDVLIENADKLAERHDDKFTDAQRARAKELKDLALAPPVFHIWPKGRFPSLESQRTLPAIGRDTFNGGYTLSAAIEIEQAKSRLNRGGQPVDFRFLVDPVKKSTPTGVYPIDLAAGLVEEKPSTTIKLNESDYLTEDAVVSDEDK